jgi:hypothetical protein
VEELYTSIKRVHVEVYYSLAKVALVFELFDLETQRRLRHGQGYVVSLTIWSTFLSTAPGITFRSVPTNCSEPPRTNIDSMQSFITLLEDLGNLLRQFLVLLLLILMFQILRPSVSPH